MPNTPDARIGQPVRSRASGAAAARLIGRLLRAATVAMVLLGLGGGAAAAGEIAITEVRWGFDGTIREFAFLPVSFLVRNDSSTLKKVPLRLGRCDLPPDFYGDVYEQEVTLAPHSSRWVQFTPMTENTVIQWHLQYGPDNADFYPLPQPRPAQRIAALLDSPARRRSPTAIDRFPADLFPVSVMATDILDLLFLDHAPEIDDVRVIAFRDWLLRGGSLVLLHDDDGRFPSFPPALAELNDSSALFRIGHGRVQRVARRARDLSASDMHDLTRVSIAPTGDPSQRSERPRVDSLPPGTVVPKSGFLFEAVVESLCRFHRPWWIIYPAALIYLGLIGPACFFLARSGNLRGFAILFLGAVLGTSALFVVVNRISVGNESRIRTIAIARQVSDRVWDIRRWSALANVASGLYEIDGRDGSDGAGRPEQRSSGSATYSSLQGRETGAVVTDGRYRLPRPTMSTMTFQQKERREFSTPWITLNSAASAAGGSLAIRESLVQLHGPLANLPAKSAVGYIQAGSLLQPLKFQQGSLVVDTGQTTLDELFQHHWERLAYQQADDFFAPTDEEIYRSLLRPLIRLAISDPRTGVPTPPPEGVRLFLLAPMPDEMKVDGDIDNQSGYVLFIIDG